MGGPSPLQGGSKTFPSCPTSIIARGSKHNLGDENAPPDIVSPGSNRLVQKAPECARDGTTCGDFGFQKLMYGFLEYKNLDGGLSQLASPAVPRLPPRRPPLVSDGVAAQVSAASLPYELENHFGVSGLAICFHRFRFGLAVRGATRLSSSNPLCSRALRRRSDTGAPASDGWGSWGAPWESPGLLGGPRRLTSMILAVVTFKTSGT